jgi:hypothetical protein
MRKIGLAHLKEEKMEETENKDVQTQDVVEPEKSESSDAQPEVATKSEESSAGTKEYNWRQMEEKHRQEREQLQKKVWELEEKSKSAIKNEEEETAQLQEDDLITYGQLDKLAEKKARAIFQDEFKKAEQAKQPLAVKQKYPDFEKVVTLENIEKLKKEDPELENLIMHSMNPYERTYKEIKRSDFYRSSQGNKESEEKIAENSKKPISSNSFGKSRPLSYANNYAKGDPSLYEEMLKYKGGSL